MTIRWPLTKLALMIVIAARVITWDDPVIQTIKPAGPLVLLPLPSVVLFPPVPPTAPPDRFGGYW